MYDYRSAEVGDDFFGGTVGTLGTKLGGRIGGDVGADLRGLQQRMTGGQASQHGPHERVAATGGVHCIDLRGGIRDANVRSRSPPIPTAPTRHYRPVESVIGESFGDLIPVE